MLNDLLLTTSANQCLIELGIDSYEQCLDKEYFANYPYRIYYFFNSRGFRDNEWPNDINNAIWCVGDSFTVGLGQPFEHTWHQQLSTLTKDNIINISLNGASNDWISRKVCYILKHAAPKTIFIQWSYLHRRENNNQLLLDEQRLMHHDPQDANDIGNFFKNIMAVESNKANTRIVHSFIPEFNKIDNNYIIYDKLDEDRILFFPNIDVVDKARDGHHYGKHTAMIYATQYMNTLKNGY